MMKALDGKPCAGISHVTGLLFAVAVVLAMPLAVNAAVVSQKSEIVVAKDAPPIVKFAAQEMKELLSGVFGEAPKTVNEPTPGKSHLFIGSNRWATAAGVLTAGLARDAFRLKCVGDDIYIAGRDDPQTGFDRLVQNAEAMFERATAFGVYEFLERYAGVRLYFPGELGTITPRAKSITVPANLDETVAPAFRVRSYSYVSAGRYFEEPYNLFQSPKASLNVLRHRMQTEKIPCCHGQNGLDLVGRFGKSHPEYFIMTKDGKRRTDPLAHFPGMICLTSHVWDEMYKDCEAYLTGGDRGYKWGKGFRYGKYCDLMCQDGLIRCECETCRERLGTGRYWASEVVWSNTCAVANRLAEKGISGYVTQMAYAGYRGIPKNTEIPTNVLVMLAQSGPWTMRNPPIRDADFAEMKGWVKKMHGRKLWLWNYANKFKYRALPDIPCLTPHAVGEYYKMTAPYIFGAYMESESDRFLYQHLNFAVFAHVLWHPDMDVDAYLDEYYARMYGEAAADMKSAFELFERKWAVEISNNSVDTPEGPVSIVPCEHAIWHEIYSPAVIDGLERMFGSAASKVAADSLEGRRVALMRREIFEPLAKRARAYIAVSAPSTPAAGDDAIVLESKDGSISAKHLPLDGSRPGIQRVVPFKRYRLSFNLEACGIEPLSIGGGAFAWMHTFYGDMGFPKFTGQRGTFARTHKEYTFFAGPDADRPGKCLKMDLVLSRAKGKAVYDDIRVEEIPPLETDVKPIVSARAVPWKDKVRLEVQLHPAFIKQFEPPAKLPLGVFLVGGKKCPADKYNYKRNDRLMARAFTAAELGDGTKTVRFELLSNKRKLMDSVEIEIPESKP